CYVYEYEGEVVGYVHAYTYNLLYAHPMVNVVGLAVKKDLQHNGIGGLLLLMVEDWASDIGAEKVCMHVGSERTIAKSFYESWGYEVRKEHLNFVKDLN
ncbi:MAG: GNAT family N-acetyltransferase, partial [Erysipelotrichaceae bacterium]|nr:GNAT family N-acetyltransferase [Erysipelotrichaceae bacterium]